jgi:hypothetical protein
VTPTLIRKAIAPGRIELAAAFASGGFFRFCCTTSGTGYGFNEASRAADRPARRETLARFVARQPGEDDLQRLARIEAFVRGVSSTTELCAAVNGSTIKL